MKQEKKFCYKCKKEIINCVCSWYVTHICEDGDEYECYECWTSRVREDCERERFCRQILQDILRERTK